MTLEAFLKSLDVPLEEGTTTLRAFWDDVTIEELDAMRDSGYGRAPYALINAPGDRSDSRTRYWAADKRDGDADITLLRPLPVEATQAEEDAASAELASVMTAIKENLRIVTELSPGQPLHGRMSVANTFYPRRRSLERFSGLTAGLILDFDLA